MRSITTSYKSVAMKRGLKPMDSLFSKISRILKPLLLAILLLGYATLSRGVTITSAATGNWNATGTWVGGVVPGAGDDVVIANGHTVTVTVSTSCNSLSMVSGNSAISGTITVNSGILLTVTNSIFITDGKSNVDFNLSGAGSIVCSSMNICTSGTAPSGSATNSFILHSGITSLTINGNLTLNGNSSSTSSKLNNPTFDLTAGTTTVTGSIVTTTAGATSGTGPTCTITTANLPATGTLILSGGIPWNLASGFIVNTTTLDGTGATVNYNSSSAQTIRATTYNTLKINNANASGATLGGATTATNLTIGDVTANSLFNDGGNQLTSTGTLTLTSGTFKLGGASATTWPTFATNTISSGTTVEYASAVAQIVSATPSYQNLTFSGAGDKTTASGTITVGGNWSVTGGTATLSTNNSNVTVTGNITGTGSITSGSGTITLGGNWTNNGTFTKGSGTVTYNGSSAQTLAALSYNNLTLSGSGQKNAAGTVTIGATLTNSSTMDIAANTLTLGTSTSNAGGTVRFSGASNGLAINSGTVEYYNSGAQNVTTGTYNNLILSGSGNKTFSGACTFSGDLAISGSAVALLANSTTSTASSLHLGGSLQSTGSWGGTGSTASNKNSTWFGSTTSGTINVGGTATRLVITGSGTQTAGSTQNITITAKDAGGTTILGYNGDKTLTFFGANASGNPVTTPTITNKSGTAINFGSSTTITFTNGVATVSGSNNGVMTLYKAETATISVTDGSISSSGADQLTVVVSAGAANKLAFTTQPGGGTGGTAWGTQPAVTLQDAYGNTVTGTAQNVTLAIQNNAGPGGTLSGTKTVAVNTGTGIASFSGLSIDKIGTGYTLTATGSTVSTSPGNIVSSAFNITVGSAAKLAFSVQPGGGTANSIWATQPVVVLQDAGGNTVTGTAANVTMAIQNNAGPGGILSGTTTVAINTGTGLATFTDLSIDKPGTGYTVTASAPSLTSSTSSAFNLDNPSPTITSISPSKKCVGAATFILTIYGTNFLPSSVVNVNGSARTTTYVNSSQLTASIPASDVVSVGTPSITVFNPTPGGGTSAGSILMVVQVFVTPTVTQPTCYSDGSISLSVSGGALPYTFDWADLSGTSNVQNRTGLQPGNYSVTATDANGCTASSGTQTLSAPTCTGLTVCQSDNASVLSVTPDPQNTSYSWTIESVASPGTVYDIITSGKNSPSVTIDWTSVPAGSYKVDVFGHNACGSSLASERLVYVTSPTAVASADPVCAGGNLHLYASGGVSYTWLGPNGFTSQSANPVLYNVSSTTNDTYTVKVTNSNGCSATANVSVTVNAGPAINSNTITNSSCGASTGAITIAQTGGTSFLWSNGSTSQNISGVPSGNYTVTVTDASGCSTQQTYAVQNSDGPSASASVVNVDCSGNNTGKVNLSVTGGATPYSYYWTATNGGIIPSGQINSQNLSGLVAGTYSVDITDASGCHSSASAFVSQPNPLQSNGIVTNVGCFGGSTGAINISASGGNGSYTYNIDEGSFGPTFNFTNLTAGTHTVYVKDGNGCQISTDYTVSQPSSALSATPSVTNVTCNGSSNGQITLLVSGGTTPYSYSWTGPSSFAASTKDITGLKAGSYSVLISDKNGCSITPSASVTEPVILGAVVNTANISCFGANDGTVTISNPSGGSGNYEYELNSGNWQSSGSFTGLGSGLYAVNIRDAVYPTCSKTLSSPTITEPSLLNATIAKTDITCNGSNDGTITLSSPSGGYGNYEYRLNSGSWQPGMNFTNLSQGIYSVQIRDKDHSACVVNLKDDESIAEPSAISVSGAITNVACYGSSSGAINVSATGGTGTLHYDWGGGILTEDRTGLAAGTYTVTVTDDNSCNNSATYTITQPGVALSLSSSQTNITCNGYGDGSINLTATGGTGPYAYSWTGPGGFTSSAEDISKLSAGTYNVIVNDHNGCSQSTTVTITEPLLLSASATPTDALCNGGATGQISLSVTGGTSGYTYLWSNGSSDQNPNGLAKGIYSVTVTDSKGCTTTANATVSEPSSLSITNTIADVKCYGGSSGSVTINISGGVGPYSYDWSDLAGTTDPKDRSSLAAGDYSLVVTDNHGCVKSATVTVGSASPLSVVVNTTDRTCLIANGSAFAQVSGGTGPYTYLWSSGGATTNSITGLDVGSYTVTVTDANLCVASDTKTIGSPSCSPPVVNNDSYTTAYNTEIVNGSVATNDSDPEGGLLTFTAVSNPTAEQGTIDWDGSKNGTFTYTPTPGYIGTFSVIYRATDPSGLYTDATLTITVVALPTKAVNASEQNICITAGSGTLAGNTPSVGTGTWSVVSGPSTASSQFSNANNPTATFTPAGGVGTYLVCWTISNPPNTSSTAYATITVNPVSVGGTATATASTMCNGGNTTISLAGNTGTIQWQESPNGSSGWADVTGGSGATTSTYTTAALTNTTYYRAVVTSGGCASSNSSSASVIVYPVTPAPTGTASQLFCSASNPKVSDISVTGSNIIWYTAATGGSVVAGTTALVDGTTYYASQTLNGCESPTRLAVTVNVAASISAPTGSATQTFCNGTNPKVSDIVVTGSNIIWYTASSGGSVVAGSTALVSGTTYYASQTIGGCESPTRLAVTVTVNPTPSAPTGSGTQNFCSSDNPKASNIIVTGSDIIWYDAAVAGNVVDGTTALVDGTTYYASQTTNGCESATRMAVKVNVNTTPSAPTGSAAQSFCNGNNPKVSDIVVTGTNIIWYDAASGGNIVAGTTALVNGTTYYASQTVNGCESTSRFAVTATILTCTGPNIINVIVNIDENSANGTSVYDVNDNNTGNDKDVNGNNLTYTIISGNASGVFTIDPATGIITVADGSKLDYETTPTFVLVVRASNGTITDDAIITINLDNLNDNAPVAVADSYSVNEGGTLNIPAPGVLANDYDADGNSLTAIKVTNPSHGTLTFNADGSFTYTHDGSETTSDAFTYKANDGKFDSDTVTVSITINPVNDPPVVSDIYKGALTDATLTFTSTDFTGAYTDIENDPLAKIMIMDLPANGTLYLSGVPISVGDEIAAASLGNITFVPSAGWKGTTSFAWNASDGSLYASASASVNITISATPNNPPVVSDITKSVGQNNTLTFTAADFTGAYTDADSNPLVKIKITSLPANAKLQLSGVDVTLNDEIPLASLGNLTLVPDANWNGNTSFGWNGFDGTVYANTGANVNITVNAVNHAPVIGTSPLLFTMAEDGGTQTINIAGNVSDVDGKTLTTSVTVLPKHGTTSIDGSGNIIYTPDANYNGMDTITYQVCDNGTPSLCATGLVIITVTPVNDPPILTNSVLTSIIDGNSGADIVDIPANTVNVDGDILTTSIATNPKHGTVSLDSNGKIVYTPDINFSGNDTIVYQVCDNGTPSLCATGKVVITVTPVNYPPILTNAVLTKSIPENSGATTIDIPANTVNIDGDVLATSITIVPKHGIATVDVNGRIVYTPDANFVGNDTITYQVCDNGTPSLCVMGIIVISVTPINTLPVINTSPIIQTISEDGGSAIIDVPGNTTNTDGDVLTTSLVKNPAHGVVSVDSNGKLIYTSNANFNGNDTITYQVCDNGTPQLCATGVSIIIVTPVNDPPALITVVLTETIPENSGAITIDIPSNTVNVDGDILSTSIVTDHKHGTASIGNDGKIIYTPDPDFVGNDTISYQVCDNGVPSLCVSGSIIITVTNTNHPPVVGEIDKTTIEDQNVSFALTDFLSKFSDTDNKDTLVKIRFVSLPLHGVVQLNGSEIIVDQDISYNDLNKLVFVPEKGYYGEVEFLWEASDGKEYVLVPAYVKITITQQEVFIPEGFSPNGDGVNDNFVIKGADKYIIKLKVFNRWGNLVYESNYYQNDWQGNSNVGVSLSKKLPDGTYYYIIDLQNGEKPKLGYITIKR